MFPDTLPVTCPTCGAEHPVPIDAALDIPRDYSRRGHPRMLLCEACRVAAPAPVQAAPGQPGALELICWAIGEGNTFLERGDTQTANGYYLRAIAGALYELLKRG